MCVCVWFRHFPGNWVFCWVCLGTCSTGFLGMSLAGPWAPSKDSRVTGPQSRSRRCRRARGGTCSPAAATPPKRARSSELGARIWVQRRAEARKKRDTFSLGLKRGGERLPLGEDVETCMLWFNAAFSKTLVGQWSSWKKSRNVRDPRTARIDLV